MLFVVAKEGNKQHFYIASASSLVRNNYWSCNLIGLYCYLGNKTKKFDFVHQTLSRQEAHAGWTWHLSSRGCCLFLLLSSSSTKPTLLGVLIW